MKQVTEAEVRGLFDDLERDADGLLNFHDMQMRIQEFRDLSVKRYKVIFPNLTPGAMKKAPKKGGGASAAVAPGGARTLMRKSVGRRTRISPDVAPPAMFLKV